MIDYSDDLIDYSKMLPWGRTPFCQEGWESPTKYRVSHIAYRRISTGCWRLPPSLLARHVVAHAFAVKIIGASCQVAN